MNALKTSKWTKNCNTYNDSLFTLFWKCTTSNRSLLLTLRPGVGVWRMGNDLTISLHRWLWPIYRRGFTVTADGHNNNPPQFATAGPRRRQRRRRRALSHIYLSCLLWLRRHNLITGIKLSYKTLLIYKRLFVFDIRNPRFLYLFIGFFALLRVSRVFHKYVYIRVCDLTK